MCNPDLKPLCGLDLMSTFIAVKLFFTGPFLVQECFSTGENAPVLEMVCKKLTANKIL